jgi:hypothetical protein
MIPAFTAHFSLFSWQRIAGQVARPGGSTYHQPFATKDEPVEAVLTDRLERLVTEAVALADERHAGKALGDFFTTLVREHPDAATLAASLEDPVLRDAFAVLLRRGQKGGTVRRDVVVDDLIPLAIGALAAVRQAGPDEAVQRRVLAVSLDGLRVRRGKRLARRR